MPTAALLRRAAAMKSASLDATASGSSMYGDSHSNLPTLFPSSSSSIAGSRSGISSLATAPPPAGGNRPVAPQQTAPSKESSEPPPTSGRAHPHIRASGPRSFSTDTELEALRNDQIEQLLRSETTEVLEEEIDEYFPETEPLTERSDAAKQTAATGQRPLGASGRNGKLTASQTSLETSV